MQIKLKQTEIVSALKDHLTSQGFNLKGKEVTMEFTAGRKGDGLLADIKINDLSEVPGYGAADIPVKPSPKAVEDALSPRLEKSTEGAQTATVDPVAGVNTEATPEGVEAAEVAAEKQTDEKADGSLFN